MAVTVSVAKQPPADAVKAIGVVATKKGPAAPPDMSAETLTRRGFEAKLGQTLVVPAADGGPTMVLVGLGEAASISADVLRTAAAAIVRVAWHEVCVATDLLDLAPTRLDRAVAAQAVTEGAILAGYQFSKYKSSPKPCRLEAFVLTGKAASARAVAEGVRAGKVIAGAVSFARDLINEPAAAKTPVGLAADAEAVAAANGLDITVWDEHDIERERCGGLRGVSLGSSQPPRLVKLVYEPVDASKSTPTLAVVGKGITFDSGGLSLKTADGMMTMKTDMSGAAAVLALMSTMAAFKPAVRIIGICCITENMPGPAAIKPGDVVRARNGKTIEVLNTDAEGRLVLADGLVLAAEHKPDAMIDIATLTGAVVVALGKEVTGLFSNHDGLCTQLEDAGKRAGEPSWRLPMPPSYRKHIDSEVADMKNMGAPGQAGSIAGAMLLQEFVDGRPWVHMDIAGTSRADSDEGIFAKGGTGAGVRTLIELARTFNAPQ